MRVARQRIHAKALAPRGARAHEAMDAGGLRGRVVITF